jgi:hypothetical protein
MAFNPYFFCDSPLPMELIQKALFELNTLSPTVVEVKEKVDKLTAELDATVKEEVTRIINEMYENGEFSEILEKISLSYFNSLTPPRVSEVNATRLFRIELNAMPFSTQDFSTPEMEKYSFVQGGTMFERQGVRYYIACAVCSNPSPYKYNDNVDVRRYMYLGGKWQFETHSIQSLGHADCITYDDVNDCFYVSYSQEFNGGRTAQAVKKVDKLDWNLSVVARYNFTNFGGQEFNRISSCYAYKGELYLGVGSSRWTNIHIEKVTSFENLTTELVVNYRDYNSVGNTTENVVMCGFTMNDNYIFVAVNQPNGVIRYNRTTNEIDNFYHIGDFINDHMFTTGEVENISLIGEEIFIGSSFTMNPTNFNYYCYMNLSKFNYVNNMNFSQGLYIPYQQMYETAFKQICCGDENNIENIGGDREICNPNGMLVNSWHYNTTSSGKKQYINGHGEGNMPFPSLGEAVMYAQLQNQYQHITIIPLTLNDVYPIVFSGDVSLSIDGSFFKQKRILSGVTKFRDQKPHIGGVYVTGGVVKLRDLCIENRTNDNASCDTFSYANGECNGAVLNMFDCILSSYGIHTDKPENKYRKFRFNACFANIDNIYNDDGSVLNFDANNLLLYHCILATHGYWTGSATTSVIN